ncbi:MAG: type II toxin-antitoxin system VapC family toxin [Novosphingobium sp.]
MIAVDTCVLVRWVLRDDPAQADVADAVLAQPFFLGVGVLVELGWVLGSIGKMSRSDMARTFETLLGLPAACVQNETHVRWAVERFSTRGDLAELLHIANSVAANAFATFDAKLLKQAGPNAPVKVQALF